LGAYILVADEPALLPDTAPPGVYRPRGTNSLQRLFHLYLPQITARYETDFAKRLGQFRLKRLGTAVERFLDCGDFTKGASGPFPAFCELHRVHSYDQ
jgi:hypothetical protein